LDLRQRERQFLIDAEHVASRVRAIQLAL